MHLNFRDASQWANGAVSFLLPVGCAVEVNSGSCSIHACRDDTFDMGAMHLTNCTNDSEQRGQELQMRYWNREFGVRDNCQLVRRGPFPLWDNSLEVVTEAVPGALSEWHCWEIRRVLPCRCILVFKLSGAGRFAENEENWMTFLRSFHLVEDVCPAALWEAQPVVHIDTKSDRQPDLDASEGQEWVAHLPANLTYLLPVFESLSCNVEDELHSGDSDLDPLTDAIAMEIKGLKFSAATELVRNHRDLLTEFLNEPDVPDRVKDIGFHIVGALLRESWIVKHIQSGER